MLAVRRAETLGESFGKILWILLKESSDIVQQTPHLRIFVGVGGGAESAAEGKDRFKALFELAKKLLEKKENKVAEKRKNFNVQILNGAPVETS